MKVYLDNNIAAPLGLRAYPCMNDQIQKIPNGADLIGLTFFYNHTNKIIPLVDIALEKSRNVVVYFAEFNGPDVARFEREYHDKYPNLQIFANAVTHYSSRLQHIGQWFLRLVNPYSKEPWAQDLLTRLDHSADRRYKFDCLLGKQTPMRDYIESLYKDCAYQQDFVFSYFKKDIQQGLWYDFEISSASKFTSDLVSYRDVEIPLSAILPTDIYNRCHYSIVAETTCPGDFNFYTEKIAKPMIAGRLFVAFAGPRYLENLRKIGFQTFHGIIDESYDQIQDNHARWKAAWDQVEFLLKQDPISIRQACQHITKHNQDLMLTTDWAAPIRDHVRTIIGRR